MHDFFRSHVYFYDHMNMIRSNMRSPEIPAVVQTDFVDGIEHSLTSYLIKEIRRLVHLLAFHCQTLCTHFRQSTAEQVVFAIHRAGFVAMQVPAIASECDEVPHTRTRRYRSFTVAAQFSVSIRYNPFDGSDAGQIAAHERLGD